MENKRMTWEEIVQKYPDKWVGLVDVKRDGGKILSAVVKYISKSRSELLEKQIHRKIEYSTYTTPENLMWNLPFGALTFSVERSL